jgi:hypothetical protein
LSRLTQALRDGSTYIISDVSLIDACPPGDSPFEAMKASKSAFDLR